jgi:hypothetical protein
VRSSLVGKQSEHFRSTPSCRSRNERAAVVRVVVEGLEDSPAVVGHTRAAWGERAASSGLTFASGRPPATK